MTRYAICGPIRHAHYVIERLKRQGVSPADILPVLARADGGNNARTAIALGADEDVNVTWTEDSQDLLAEHVPNSAYLSGPSPTPVHAIFNMFWQNEQAARQVPEGVEVIARMRSDMVLYDDCLARLQAASTGLAWNPIALDSDNVSDQFIAFPRDAYARIWATEGFAETFAAGEGIPESMIRDRVQDTLGEASFAFERFIDFDIIYEATRWSDSPRVFWLKKFFGWQACYAASGHKGGLALWIERLHLRTLGHSDTRCKVANVLLKILYLPIFALQVPRIRKALAAFPAPQDRSGCGSVPT